MRLRSRGPRSPIGAAELTETLGSMLPQQRAELVVANLAEATLRIATADDPAQLAVLATPVKRSLQQLEEHIAGFPPKLQARAKEQFTTFEDGLLGARGLIAVRGLELAALERAHERLDENAAISARLTAAVDGLVADARGEMTAATADAASVQQVELAGPDRGGAAEPAQLRPDRLALRPARSAAAAHRAQRQHAGGRRRQSARAAAAAGRRGRDRRDGARAHRVSRHRGRDRGQGPARDRSAPGSAWSTRSRASPRASPCSTGTTGWCCATPAIASCSIPAWPT